MPPRRIDPTALNRVSRMELVARDAVEGFLAGRHPSPFHGSSVEYADHRPYGLGDEIRSLDWKLLAKTDKLYVKLYEEQTNLRCTLLLDASKSMGFGGAPAANPGPSGDNEHASARLSKIDYAAHLAAALAYLMLRQNDAVGLGVYEQRLRHYLPARSTAAHFRRMVDTLEGVEPGGASDAGPAMHELASRLQRRGMVIVISDLLDNTEALMDALAHFRYRKHEVIVFHVMDVDELAFPYQRLTRFRDMEGTAAVVANPAGVRKRYLERLDKFLTSIKAGCLERGVGYELARTDAPWDRMLGAYLARRSRLTA